MKIFKWRPKFIRRRDELIVRQDITLQAMYKHLGGLEDMLTKIKYVWNLNYELVKDNKLGRTRMTAFIDDFIQKTIPTFAKKEEVK